ncbi:hypothetical protein BC939DRAFT_460333 [Gamsiella multidivaricata]|uniref:uncharacterized protein n=1 Tax=Gamsiella multidivaricata TaxID=101098 RepID=UPI00221EAB5A|nr:uncharacterized protein BC939DRAFT_460333 [Gamsiella multidivaricata]KAI7819290.1 hypothetical protein BC939DRAFT_460333 [Gamsiella multidivaricata]
MSSYWLDWFALVLVLASVAVVLLFAAFVAAVLVIRILLLGRIGIVASWALRRLLLRLPCILFHTLWWLVLYFSSALVLKGLFFLKQAGLGCCHLHVFDCLCLFVLRSRGNDRAVAIKRLLGLVALNRDPR